MTLEAKEPYTWIIEGSRVEWCTKFPGTLVLRSPRFTIHGIECWFELTNTDASAQASDLRPLYTIKMKQMCSNADYKPFPVTVHAGYMCDENFIFPSMKNKYYTVDKNIWFVRRCDVLKNMRKDAINYNFLKFHFVFEEFPDPLPTIKKLRVTNEVEVSVPQFNLENMSQDWSELLRSSAHSDVKLKCRDGVLQAHKVVLTARSKVFSAMFQSDMRERQSGVIDISDVNVATMKLFLEFVYSGNIKTLPPQMVPSLYSLGDRYAVDALRKMCAISMISNLSKENYIHYLHLATSHSDECLIKALGDCISNNYLQSANRSDRSRVIGTLKEKFGMKEMRK